MKVALDSDDELPFITFSCSSMPSPQKSSEDTTTTNTTKGSSSLSHGRDTTVTAQSSDLRTNAASPGVIMVDSDSSDSDSWKECTFKYNRNLQERCISSADCTSTPSSDLQSGIDSARASVTDDQSRYSGLTDDSPAAWKSCEDSERQTAASDVNSQTSSVHSDGGKRRKRQQKADNPEVVVAVVVIVIVVVIERIILMTRSRNVYQKLQTCTGLHGQNCAV